MKNKYHILTCFVILCFMMQLWLIDCSSDKKTPKKTKQTVPTDESYSLSISFAKGQKKNLLLDFSVKLNQVDIQNLPSQISSFIKKWVSGGRIKSLSGDAIIPFVMEITSVDKNSGSGLISIHGVDKLQIGNKIHEHEVLWSVNHMPIPLIPTELKFLKGYSAIKSSPKIKILDVLLNKKNKKNDPKSIPNISKAINEDTKLLLSLPTKKVKIGETWENSFNSTQKLFGIPPIFYGQGTVQNNITLKKTLNQIKGKNVTIDLNAVLTSTGNFSDENNQFDYSIDIKGNGNYVFDKDVGLLVSCNLPVDISMVINIKNFHIKQSFFETTFKDTIISLKGKGKIVIKSK